MVDRQGALLMVLIILVIYPNDIFGGAFPPEFAGPITNLTVPVGRDATLTCLVKHLGGYRIGWLKVDTKAIQAIHDHVITHNTRVSVSHSDHTMWNLHIKSVQPEDEGLYMCQINTDPMKSQTGMLSIVVPPDFIPEETSSDVMVREGGQVKLTCHAKGVPPPRISWRREDGKNIIIRKPFAGSALNQMSHVLRKEDLYRKLSALVSSVSEYQGEELKLIKISRNEMGVYLCIASNSVPPAVSKRIFINVHFSPVIHVPNQLVGAPLGTDVGLECFVEASPKSINYWVKDNGKPGKPVEHSEQVRLTWQILQALNHRLVWFRYGIRNYFDRDGLCVIAMIIWSQHHDVEAIVKSQFEMRMLLTIRNLQKHDVGTYKCVAKNSLGDVESSIRLYEMSGSAKTQTAVRPSFYDEEDETVYGSAEIEKMENKVLPVDNAHNGHMRYPSIATSMPTIRVNKKRQKTIARANADCHLSSDLLVISMLIVAHRRYQ